MVFLHMLKSQDVKLFANFKDVIDYATGDG